MIKEKSHASVVITCGVTKSQNGNPVLAFTL